MLFIHSKKATKNNALILGMNTEWLHVKLFQRTLLARQIKLQVTRATETRKINSVFQTNHGTDQRISQVIPLTLAIGNQELVLVILTLSLPKSNLESINVVVLFESVDETLVQCDHSNESY